MHDHYKYLCRLVRHRLATLADDIDESLVTREEISDLLRATATLMEVGDHASSNAPHGSHEPAV